MSYTTISGMRSNRYPLMGSGDGLGCGCGCNGTGACGSMGQEQKPSYAADALAIGVVGVLGIGTLLYFARDAKPKRNRRRSSRRR